MSRSPRFLPAFAAPVLLIGLLSRAGVAGDSQADAEKLIRHGVELRRGHDDEAAQREFQKAYELVHSPRAAGQLGLAEQALGRWEDAERHVSEAIHASGDAWVAKNRTALDDALNTIQAHLGRVEVIGDPEGAEVSVNGHAVGKLPLPEPVRVSAGEVDIEMHATDYVGAQRTVTIVGGQYQRVVIHLVKVPPAAEPVPGAPAQPISPVQPPAITGGPPPSETGPSGTRLALKWGALGLAGAGLVTGVAFTVLHSQNVSAFENHGCRIDSSGNGVLNSTGKDDGTCGSTLNTSKTYQGVLVAGYVGAGVFAATWLVLELTEPSRGGGASAVEHAAGGPICAPAFSRPGLSCVIRF